MSITQQDILTAMRAVQDSLEAHIDRKVEGELKAYVRQMVFEELRDMTTGRIRKAVNEQLDRYYASVEIRTKENDNGNERQSEKRVPINGFSD